MRFEKTFRYLYYRCVRLHGKPREVAMGMAIGLVIGLTPTMGLQMVLAIAVAAVLGQSKIAAGVGVWISNPVTAVPLYAFTYGVGAWCMGALGVPVGQLGETAAFREFIHHLQDSGAALSTIRSYGWSAFWHESRSFLILSTVGGLLVSVPLAPAGYWLTYQAVIAYRLKVRNRRANRLHKWKWNPHDGWHRVSVHKRPHGERTGG